MSFSIFSITAWKIKYWPIPCLSNVWVWAVPLLMIPALPVLIISSMLKHFYLIFLCNPDLFLLFFLLFKQHFSGKKPVDFIGIQTRILRLEGKQTIFRFDLEWIGIGTAIKYSPTFQEDSCSIYSLLQKILCTFTSLAHQRFVSGEVEERWWRWCGVFKASE